MAIDTFMAYESGQQPGRRADPPPGVVPHERHGTPGSFRERYRSRGTARQALTRYAREDI